MYLQIERMYLSIADFFSEIFLTNIGQKRRKERLNIPSHSRIYATVHSRELDKKLESKRPLIAHYREPEEGIIC